MKKEGCNHGIMAHNSFKALGIKMFLCLSVPEGGVVNFRLVRMLYLCALQCCMYLLYGCSFGSREESNVPCRLLQQKTDLITVTVDQLALY